MKYSEWEERRFDTEHWRERFPADAVPPMGVGYIVLDDEWDFTTTPPSRTIKKVRLMDVSLLRGAG